MFFHKSACKLLYIFATPRPNKGGVRAFIVTVQELQHSYLTHKGVEELDQALTGKLQQRIFLKGVHGSADAFIVSALATKRDGSHLLIANDKEEAAYLFNDLENTFHIPDNVLFFPASSKQHYKPEQTDNANVLMRAKVLNRLNDHDQRSKLIVTYPEALVEKVVTKAHLKTNTLEIIHGGKYSIDFIDELLLDFEFEKVDYVFEPGQFSIRGGIVDVFSFSNEDPYRIEFFGDEVDSIRTFDTINQLSKQKLAVITIVPNVQEKLLRESRQFFFDYIHSSTTIWFKSVETAGKIMDRHYAKAVEIYQSQTSTIKQLEPTELYMNGDGFRRDLLRFSLVAFGLTNELNFEKQIVFNTTLQPSFNKNFDLLANHFHQHKILGYTNIICADQVKQLERMYRIFEDKKYTTKFIGLNLSLREGFTDHDLKIACFTDHQLFERYHRFKLQEGFNKTKEAITLKELLSLQKGDYVTHIDHGIGQYSGLEKILVSGKEQEAIRLIYKGGDVVYVSIHSLHRISKYVGKEGTVPVLNKLGTNTWENLKNKTKKKVKEIAYDLIKLYAKRRSEKGFQFSPDTYLQTELEASFIYEDTPDQLKSTQAVKHDMEQPYPMDRLICGDVGFGKTEVAIRAAFKAVTDSKQVAILVPTTILSLQHYKNFQERLKDFPCTIDYINRFKSPGKQKDTLERVAKGQIDILIGTHRVVAKDVKFRDLGLLIIDEEQKFGVGVKDKLKLLKANVDTLTLTATPIPRTLQFSLMGARDLSVINTAPPNRYPVQTELTVYNEEIIRDRITYEVERGGQVFFIHNRVQNITEVAAMIQRICPQVRIAVGHGQMEGDRLEEIMVDFMDGQYDVLVATTIIESGIDVSNANTIIINDAHNFGLSDLHQLRGRVGRSNKKAFCILMVPGMQLLTQEARRRLSAIEQFSDLGSGFSIAMRDLDIRGAGNLLGGEQSGFISDIGYETYQKILDEALHELKETEFRDLYKVDEDSTYNYVNDCVIETDLELLIPDSYVNNVTERLILYRELDDIKEEEALQKFRLSLVDRFGPLHKSTEELIDTVRLRWLAKDIGFEKLILKQKKLIGHFITNPKSPFYESSKFTRVLKYIEKHHRTAKMEEKNGRLQLSYENISGIHNALEKLRVIVDTDHT